MYDSFINARLKYLNGVYIYRYSSVNECIPVATYVSGAWTWFAAFILKYAGVKTLRRITRFCRKPGEAFVDHTTRATRRSRQMFHNTGNLRQTTTVLDTLHHTACASFARQCCETQWQDENEHDVSNYTRLVETIIPVLFKCGIGEPMFPPCLNFMV